MSRIRKRLAGGIEIVLWHFPVEVNPRGGLYAMERLVFECRRGVIGVSREYWHPTRDGQWWDDHTAFTGLHWIGRSEPGDGVTFGPDHWWYDGPHCGFVIGPVRICWAPRKWDCPKCHGCNGE